MVQRSDCVTPSQETCRDRPVRSQARTEHHGPAAIPSELELEEFLVSYHALVRNTARRTKPRRRKRS